MSRKKTIWLGSMLGVLAVVLIGCGASAQPSQPMDEPMRETKVDLIPLLFEHPSATADVYCYDYDDELFHRTSIEQTDGRRNFDVPCPSPLGEGYDLPSTIVLHSVLYCKGDESTDGVDRYLHFLGDNYRTCDEVDNPPHHNGVYRVDTGGRELFYSGISIPTDIYCNTNACDAQNIYVSQEPEYVDVYCYTHGDELYYHTRTVSYPRGGESFCPSSPDMGMPIYAARLRPPPQYCITPNTVRLLHFSHGFPNSRSCMEEVSAPPLRRRNLVTYEPQALYEKGHAMAPAYLTLDS